MVRRCQKKRAGVRSIAPLRLPVPLLERRVAVVFVDSPVRGCAGFAEVLYVGPVVAMVIGRFQVRTKG
jgi:hypothetical protein